MCVCVSLSLSRTSTCAHLATAAIMLCHIYSIVYYITLTLYHNYVILTFLIILHQHYVRPPSYISLSLCICMYMYVYVYTYTYIYIYIYMFSLSNAYMRPPSYRGPPTGSVLLGRGLLATTTTNNTNNTDTNTTTNANTTTTTTTNTTVTTTTNNNT